MFSFLKVTSFLHIFPLLKIIEKEETKFPSLVNNHAMNLKNMKVVTRNLKALTYFKCEFIFKKNSYFNNKLDIEDLMAEYKDILKGYFTCCQLNYDYLNICLTSIYFIISSDHL